jgi:hypothetical protein
MNITIKITHTNGTSMDIAIPVLIPEPVSAATSSTLAVSMPEQPHPAVEPAILVESDKVADDDKGWSAASNKLSESLEKLEKLEKALEKEGVGEEGEGDGRIGGMGERKEEGGEGEGREEKPEQIEDSIFNFQFPTKQGTYAPPAPLVRDFISVFGEECVLTEFLKARAWLLANPDKQKKLRGMGRYLNSWLCHKNGFNRVSIKQQVAIKTGSLIDDAKETSQGW